MKPSTLALLAAAAALAATSLSADTRISLGVNFGGPAYRPAPPVVVYAPPAAVMVAPPPMVTYAPAPGYWDEVVVKTWVPERWVFARDRWGRSGRVCEPGYYTFRTDRVWVDGRNSHHPASHSGRSSHDRWGR